MQAVTTIGLDIAKSVFQVHGVDAEGKVLIRRQLKRRYVLAFFQKLPPRLVGIEACATSHHWSRELKALGHAVRLMPPTGHGGFAIGHFLEFANPRQPSGFCTGTGRQDHGSTTAAFCGWPVYSRCSRE
jgi:hypothetical protein